MDLTKINTRVKAVNALKKLGFSNPGYDFTRGAKLMTGHDMTFQVAPGNFLVTDRQQQLGFIPMLLGNTAANANTQYNMLMGLMLDCGLIPQGTRELPILGLCVGIAKLAVMRTEGAIVAVTNSSAEA
jgi:hypothetical protein